MFLLRVAKKVKGRSRVRVEPVVVVRVRSGTSLVMIPRVSRQPQPCRREGVTVWLQLPMGKISRMFLLRVAKKVKGRSRVRVQPAVVVRMRGGSGTSFH